MAFSFRALLSDFLLYYYNLFNFASILFWGIGIESISQNKCNWLSVHSLRDFIWSISNTRSGLLEARSSKKEMNNICWYRAMLEIIIVWIVLSYHHCLWRLHCRLHFLDLKDTWNFVVNHDVNRRRFEAFIDCRLLFVYGPTAQLHAILRLAHVVADFVISSSSELLGFDLDVKKEHYFPGRLHMSCAFWIVNGTMTWTFLRDFKN